MCYYMTEKEIIEIRLSRIENIVYGSNKITSDEFISLNIPCYVDLIETKVNNLVKESEVLKKMMNFLNSYSFLLEEKVFSLFKSSNTIQSEKIRLIFLNLHLYNNVLSQMLSIKELSISDSNICSQAASKIPQFHIMLMAIKSFEIQLNHLSKRIAKILELWYEIGINAVNDCFLEWDERINDLNLRLKKQMS
ncbi:hypothetical protein T552_03321 [Pneumocystis carinii B80]|uniref:Uncharacterized protein n=1 Tax=Pneumocystis carinii (strain B80) TaxID=1408658 RepID=A0A0W4ZBK2_PNEC8|nr:hypothetical protein T552_03321 [Pneumocystis carinii B80]KTW25709.1 hypothetical protein T552_03321 [Pneumocystis carinii B80]